MLSRHECALRPLLGSLDAHSRLNGAIRAQSLLLISAKPSDGVEPRCPLPPLRYKCPHTRHGGGHCESTEASVCDSAVYTSALRLRVRTARMEEAPRTDFFKKT